MFSLLRNRDVLPRRKRCLLQMILQSRPKKFHHHHLFMELVALVHSDERPYACNECNKTYKTNRNLSRHKEYHNKEERGEGIACNIC